MLFSHKSEAHRCVREYGSAPTDPLFKVREQLMMTTYLSIIYSPVS